MTIARLRCMWIFIALQVLLLPFIEASPVVFSNRSAFLAATGNLTPEGFEGLLATNTNTQNILSVGNITITSTPAILGIWNQNTTGGHATQGTQYLIGFDQAGGASTATFQFATPISAIGFDLIDWESGPTIPLVFSYERGTFSAAIGTTSGGEEFFGIVDSQPFNSFSLVESAAALGDGWALDALVFGTPVPVPSLSEHGFLVLGVSLLTTGGFLLVRKRRSTSTP